MVTPTDLLEKLIASQAGEQKNWFEEQISALSKSGSERDLHIFLGLVPRKLGKADLVLTDRDIRAADEARKGWNPEGWSIDGAARVLGLLVFSGNRPFADCFKDLRRTADVAEMIALYRGLPLYREPESLSFEAGEGLRSHMRSVFEAIAHNNPYPRDHFDEHRWNHMILKALFVGSKLAPIVGLDERANPELARIMREYAHERWAAKRPVSPELWRCVGPFADDTDAINDLARALNGTKTEAAAAALALTASPSSEAKKLLEGRPEVTQIAEGSLTWDTLDEVE